MSQLHLEVRKIGSGEEGLPVPLRGLRLIEGSHWQMRVLLIEDEPTTAKAIELMLANGCWAGITAAAETPPATLPLNRAPFGTLSIGTTAGIRSSGTDGLHRQRHPQNGKAQGQSLSFGEGDCAVYKPTWQGFDNLRQKSRRAEGLQQPPACQLG